MVQGRFPFRETVKRRLGRSAVEVRGGRADPPAEPFRARSSVAPLLGPDVVSGQMPLELAVGFTQPVATFVATEVMAGATVPHNGRLLPSRGDSLVICSVGGQLRSLSSGDHAQEEAAREKAGEAFDELLASGERHLAIGTVAGCVPVGVDDCTLTFDRVELIPPGNRPNEPGATEGLFLIVEPRS